MESGVAMAAAQIVEKAFENTDYELVDVEFKRERSGWNIIVYADKPDGLTLDDCEIITHMIDPLLDEDETIAGRHDHLIVSSPGLDRPLVRTKDFARCIGKKLDIKFFSPMLGKRTLTVTLTGVDEEYIYTQTDAMKPLDIPRENIASAKQYIDFS